MDDCRNRAPGPLEWKDSEGEQMVDEEAIDAAWNTLKPKLCPKNWTVSESFTFRGFFSWGWEARKQYIQPEIDALKAENEAFRRQVDTMSATCVILNGRMGDMKAENEKLRKAAEELLATLSADWEDITEVQNLRAALNKGGEE